MSRALKWWQNGVIYQLLVPSFLDTKGTGTGDLQGIIDRLDYVRWLGVAGLWLSPIFPSPMAEFGYDITDFENIEPSYGGLETFDRLLRAAHQLDLKIMIDWVPNHTSNEHPWFVESRASRENPRRDWYIWRDAKPDGSPPSNWISVFGGSVWEWDETTRQYYLHTFLAEQPDLNWRNPEVRREMLNNLRFWLARGVDGVRIDALHMLLKDPQLRDNPPNPNYTPDEGPDSQQIPLYTRDQEGIHEIVAEMRSIVDAFGDDRLLAAELYLSIDQMMHYYGDAQPELHLPLNLYLGLMPWDAEQITTYIQQYVDKLPAHGWPTWTLSTHDGPRLGARCANEHQLRLAAMLLMSLPGTPTLYYGEEIGMHGVPIPPEQAIDPQGRRTGRNRDPARTPMQWEDVPGAGFSTATPWLPIGSDVAEANVASQDESPHSLLMLYRTLIMLRAKTPLLVEGRLTKLQYLDGVVTFERHCDVQSLVVALNFKDEPVRCRPTSGERCRGRVLLNTYLDRERERVSGEIILRGGEGMIITC